MAALLDVNVLIALLDADHLHHGAATNWLQKHVGGGWASCPLTQNGCIRILSQRSYPNRAPAAEVAARLAEATQHPAHRFWPDSISLLTPDTLDWTSLLTGRHVTDAYLLALAVKNKGTFVTLDQGAPLAAVTGAQARHLTVLSCLRGTTSSSRGRTSSSRAPFVIAHPPPSSRGRRPWRSMADKATAHGLPRCARNDGSVGARNGAAASRQMPHARAMSGMQRLERYIPIRSRAAFASGAVIRKRCDA